MNLTPTLIRIGNDTVALHAAIHPDGVVLIDAGLPGHFRPLERALATVGLSLADVRGVLLTHGDSDHIGIAERLRADHGVPVFVHEADAARARGEGSTSPAWGAVRVGPLLRFAGYSIARGGLRTRHLTEVRTFVDGDVLPLPGAPRIVSLPGHSPGSVAVHLPEAGALFVGDALTTGHVLTGAQGPQPAPFTDDPDAAAAALSHLEGIDAPWVIPGHGAPWTQGVPALLAAYRAG